MSDTTSTASRKWPSRMRRRQACKYLDAVHNLPFEEKTLRNRNARGLDPRPVYLGTVPYYTPAELDRFANEAFVDESPVAALRRRMRERRLGPDAA